MINNDYYIKRPKDYEGLCEKGYKIYDGTWAINKRISMLTGYSLMADLNDYKIEKHNIMTEDPDEES